jgi:hypothetical protein
MVRLSWHWLPTKLIKHMIKRPIWKQYYNNVCVLVTLMQCCGPKFSFLYTLWCRVTVLMKTEVYEQVTHQYNRMFKYIYNIILAMVTEATVTFEVMILTQPPSSHPCSRFWRFNTYQSLSLNRILIQFTHLSSLQHIFLIYFTSWRCGQRLPETSVNFNQLTVDSQRRFYRYPCYCCRVSLIFEMDSFSEILPLKFCIHSLSLISKAVLPPWFHYPDNTR